MPRGHYSQLYRANTPQHAVSVDSEGNCQNLYIRGNSIEMGDGALASAVQASALGPNSAASAANATSVGSGVANNVQETVALGANSVVHAVLGAANAVMNAPAFCEVSDVAHTTGATVLAATAMGPNSVVDVNAGGAGNVVLAGGAALDAAFPQLGVGQGWLFYVQNNLGAAAAATIAASEAGITLDGDTTAAVADQLTAAIVVRKTAAATYIARCVGRGTH